MKETQRADRRRDVRPHVLHRGLLRPRRRAVRRRAPAAHRRRRRAARVDELLADVPEVRLARRSSASTCPTSRSSRIVDAAVQHFRATHDVIDVDGVRVLFGDGWGLIRASNTQPVLVTRFEARTPERLAGDPRRDGRLAARAGRRRSDVTRAALAARSASPVAALAAPRRARALAGVYVDYRWYEALGAAPSGARASHDPCCCASARVRRRGALRLRQPLRRAQLGRLARPAAPGRRTSRSARRCPAGYLAGRRRAVASSLGVAARAPAGRLDDVRCSRASGGRSARPIRTSSATSASSSTGCRSRRRCYVWALIVAARRRRRSSSSSTR